MRTLPRVLFAIAATCVALAPLDMGFISPTVRTEAASIFTIQYDASVPTEARPAIQAAVDVWAGLLVSTIPIEIAVSFYPYGIYDPIRLTFGGPAGKITIRDFIGAPLPATEYPEALAKALTGHDFYPTVPELVVSVNSSVNWYMGTDGNTGGRYDLETAVLRELARGLGLASSFYPFLNRGWGTPNSPFPWAMDRFVMNGAGQVLVDTFANNSPALRAEFFKDNLFFSGPNARRANGGQPPKLSAPATWTIYDEIEYLDEAAFPAGSLNGLLTPKLNQGEVIHQPGRVVLGMMRDLGWTLTGKGLMQNPVGDLNGDGRDDMTVFRPSNGTWYTLYSGSGGTAGVQWGNGADIPVLGDYDGDGKSDVAVFRPSAGTWYIIPSSTGIPRGVQWGNGLDVPVPGDYDGDGKTDIAVFRRSSGTWYVIPSSTGIATGTQWGNGLDTPVPGDYDGDGKTDIAVFRHSSGAWYVIPSSTGIATGTQWGNGLDIPVPGDYDGDGKTDIAVFRPSDGTWYVIKSSSGVPFGIQWGNGADVPILKRP